MENKTQLKKTNVPFVVFSSIFGALALSAIVFFHLWGDVEWVKLYLVAMRWLVLPILSLVVGYTATINKAPKGLVWLAPVILGFGISLVEWATYGSFSIVLLGLGALAALFGFTFAKMDRKEKAREARKAAKKAGAVAEDMAKPKAAVHDDEYNPGADFVPDDDDTWADEILAEEGYGEIKVDYAESDPDFTIDSPDAVNEEDEASVESEDDEAITDAYDTDDTMPEDGDVENVESTPGGDESEEEPAEALDGDLDEADGDDADDVDADEPSDDKGEEANSDETDVVDDSDSDDSKTVNE